MSRLYRYPQGATFGYPRASPRAWVRRAGDTPEYLISAKEESVALTPDERKVDPPSAHAWSVVTGDTPIPFQGEEQPATVAIYAWFREWMKSTCKRPITWHGTPLTPEFRWVSKAQFNGRSMVTLAEELESAALESAAHAVDAWDPERAPLAPWIKTAMLRDLNTELERWGATSSNVSQDREGHFSLDALVETLGFEYGTLPEGLEAELSREDRPLTVDQELARQAVAVMSPLERRVMELHTDNHTLAEIGGALGLDRRHVWKIVKRAKDKARAALLGED